jgi:hypothetical protein
MKEFVAPILKGSRSMKVAARNHLARNAASHPGSPEFSVIFL